MSIFSNPKKRKGLTRENVRVEDEDAIFLLNRMSNILEQLLIIVADSQNAKITDKDLEKDNLR